MIEAKTVDDLGDLSPGEIVFSERSAVLDEARRIGMKSCAYFSVNSAELLELSCRTASKYDYAAVDFDLPTNIPLELILARLQKRRTVILRRAGSVNEMEVAFGVLETGSDGVLFAADDAAEVRSLAEHLTMATCAKLKLQPMAVKAVSYVGMGMRACVDTVGLLGKDEGMLVGSTSAGGVFICSETHYLPYMNLRPFRVNAGAVHSYIWIPNGATAYLTDLEAGAKVLCVNTKGETRELAVGRVKIEARPLLLIKGEAGGGEINVIVQDDWHIRLMGGNGEPRNATAIVPGDELLAYTSQPGRHVGLPVAESVIES